MNLHIETQTRLEYPTKGDARILVDTFVDGTQYTNVHVSGPRYIVEDYYYGRITFGELREYMSKR